MVTFKNVHSLLDRNIIRCPNKNVERSLAKNSSSRSLTKNSCWLPISSDSNELCLSIWYKKWQWGCPPWGGGDYRLPQEEESSKVYKALGVTESENVHVAGVGENCLKWIEVSRMQQYEASRSMRVRIIMFTFLDSQYEKTFKFGTCDIQHYFHNIQNKGIVFARLSVSYRLSMLWNHILTITNQGSTV